MALFELDSVKSNPEISQSLREPAMDSSLRAIPFRKLKNALGEIKAGDSIHYISKGSWSNHQLLVYLLSITGTAEVFFCTWAIQETPVREMLQLLKEKKIISIEAIFDYKIQDRKNAAFHLAKENFKSVTLCKCHAKVFVLKGEQLSITVNGSANFTRNPRIESGVITASHQVAEFHINWMKEKIKEHAT